MGRSSSQSPRAGPVVIWTVGAQSVLPQEPREPNDDALPELETPAKSPGGVKRRLTSADDFCADWNNGTCSKQAKDCSHRKVHCCNFVENGHICGKWQHTAMVHRKWVSQDNARERARARQSMGKGKAKHGQDKGNTGKPNKGKGKNKGNTGKQRF